MNTLLLIVSTLALAGITGGSAWFIFRNPLGDKTLNILFGAGSCLIGILAVVLLIYSAKIPPATTHYLSLGIEAFEEQYGDTSETIDLNKISSLTSQQKQFQEAIDNDATAGFVVQMLGAKAIVATLDRISDNADSLINDFQETNLDPTIHNVLYYCKDSATEYVSQKIILLQEVIIIIGTILIALLSTLHFAFHKGWITEKTSSVRFGEEYV